MLKEAGVRHRKWEIFLIQILALLQAFYRVILTLIVRWQSGTTQLATEGLHSITRNVIKILYTITTPNIAIMTTRNTTPGLSRIVPYSLTVESSFSFGTSKWSWASTKVKNAKKHKVYLVRRVSNVLRSIENIQSIANEILSNWITFGSSEINLFWSCSQMLMLASKKYRVVQLPSSICSTYFSPNAKLNLKQSQIGGPNSSNIHTAGIGRLLYWWRT